MPRIDPQRPHTNQLAVGRRIVVTPINGTSRLTITSPHGVQTPIKTTNQIVVGPFALEQSYRVDVYSGLADVSEEYAEQSSMGSGPIPIDADMVLQASDDGKTFACTTALTVTVPAGLSPRPNVAILPPATGNLSVASGGPNINGATSTVTRTRSTNPAGVVLVPYPESDAYGLSGS